MDKIQALALISEVCSKTNTDLQSHQAIQTAIEIIRKEITPVEKPAKKE